MVLKYFSQISIHNYWKRVGLIPGIATCVTVCLAAVFCLHVIDKRKELDELKMIAEIVSESIYSKVDCAESVELSRIVFDIGKFHNVIIIVTSPDDKPVASYPAVVELVNSSLSFNIVHKHTIKLDGVVLGRVVIKRTRQFRTGLNDATFLVGAVLIVFIGSLIWQLKFSKLMVFDIFNLSLNNRNEKNFTFKEISDVNSLLTKQNQELNELAAKTAITQMTQMLAHDTRRPFTMLEGVLSLIESANDSESRQIAKKLIPEVRRALQAVNGMIADVMEAGSINSPVK